MILLDANYILRFLLKDNDEISKDVIKNNECIILNEVLAEIVFVLQKVYQVSREDITKILILLITFCVPNQKALLSKLLIKI